MPDLGVAHLTGGQPNRFSRGREPSVSEVAQQPLVGRGLGQGHRVVAGFGPDAPAVHDHEGDGPPARRHQCLILAQATVKLKLGSRSALWQVPQTWPVGWPTMVRFLSAGAANTCRTPEPW